MKSKTLETLTTDDTDKRSIWLINQLNSYTREALHMAADLAPGVRTQAIDIIAEAISPDDPSGDQAARLHREVIRSFLRERIAYESWMLQKIASLQLMVECLVDGQCFPTPPIDTDQ